MVTFSFLTEEAATRAIDSLHYRTYENMSLRVKHAGQNNKYVAAIHRISPQESKFESLSQHSATKLARNVSPYQIEGSDVANPSLGRNYGDSSKTSPSEQTQCLSKSVCRGGKAIETPSNFSELSSRQHCETSFSGTQDGNDGVGSREVSESAKVTTTTEQEVKIVEDFPKLSGSLLDSSTAEKEHRITKDAPRAGKIFQNSSTVEKGVNIANGPPEIMRDLENPKIQPKVVSDLPEQQKSTEPEQGSGTSADALAQDSIIKDQRQLPQNTPGSNAVSATETQANQDTDASISSLAPVENSALPRLSDTKDPNRLSHKVRWKLQQRATKVAKQKQILENQQKKSGTRAVGSLAKASEESIALDVKSEGTDTSASEKIHVDLAEQHVRLKTDMRISLDENSQSESIGPTESSTNTQNEVSLASKVVEAPKTLPTSVSEASSANGPSLPEQLEVQNNEAPSLSTTAVTTQKKKKKKKPNNSTKVEKIAESASKHELNSKVIQEVTSCELLPDQVEEECATRSVGSRDDSSETLLGDEAIERNHEPFGPLCTESGTPIQNHPASPTSRPKNTKTKKARKSKGKGKAKSSGGSSQTPAFHSQESAAALTVPLEGVVQASAGLSEALAETLNFEGRSLPKPERPFVVDETHDTLHVETGKKGYSHTHNTPLTNIDKQGNSQTQTVSPVETVKKQKGRKQNKPTSTGEEPHICSRRELSRYHHLKDSDYWPQLSKIILKPAVRDPNSCTQPMPKEFQDVEIGEPGTSHCSPMESIEEYSLASTNESDEAKAIDDESKRDSLEAVIQAEQFMQTLGEVVEPSSRAAAKPKPLSLGITPPHDLSPASAADSSLQDPEAVIEHPNVLSSGLSLICKPGIHLKSSPEPGSASSDIASPSKTPILTPQTTQTFTNMDSLSSQGTLSSDESSESSTAQSEGDMADNGGDELAAIKVEDGPSSPCQIPSLTVYPSHPSATPLRSLRSSWLQPEDMLAVTATGVNGGKNYVNVLQDKAEVVMINLEVKGQVREKRERRDNHVIVGEEEWGYAKEVWIN